MPYAYVVVSHHQVPWLNQDGVIQPLLHVMLSQPAACSATINHSALDQRARAVRSAPPSPLRSPTLSVTALLLFHPQDEGQLTSMRGLG